jgi:putative two-component system response regulator
MDNMEDTAARPTVLVRPTILVVDDADENLMIMESILAKEYSLKLFNQAKEALDYAFSNPPDLILLDVMMPEIDGFEACRRLKANPKLADIPVIFITSKNEDEYEEMGFSVGASDFIHKPINAPILVARVKTHLKIKFVMDYLRKENVRLQGSAKQSSSELVEIMKMLWGSPFIKF